MVDGFGGRALHGEQSDLARSESEVRAGVLRLGAAFEGTLESALSRLRQLAGRPD
jgi:hypothetical protein